MKKWYPWYPTRTLLDPKIEYWSPSREPLHCPDCIGPEVNCPSPVMPEDDPKLLGSNRCLGWLVEHKTFNCQREIKSFNRKSILEFNKARETRINTIMGPQMRRALRDLGFPEDAVTHLLDPFRMLVSFRQVFSLENELGGDTGEKITPKARQFMEYFPTWIESKVQSRGYHLPINWTLWPVHSALIHFRDKTEVVVEHPTLRKLPTNHYFHYLSQLLGARPHDTLLDNETRLKELHAFALLIHLQENRNPEQQCAFKDLSLLTREQFLTPVENPRQAAELHVSLKKFNSDWLQQALWERRRANLEELKRANLDCLHFLFFDVTD
jgi:hypothetical protein